MSQFHANSQAEGGDPKSNSSYFSEINIALNLPFGDFARTDSLNPSSGFAGAGMGIFAGYGKLYYDRIGFEVALGVSVYSLDDNIDKIKDLENAREYQRGFGWWTISGLIGPCFSLPVKKFSFDFRVLAGVSNVIRPYFRNLDETLTLRLEETVGYGCAFAWQLGAGLKYRITDKAGLKLSLDYMGSSPVIKYQESMAYYNVYFHKDDIKYKQPISSINAGLGVVFNIDGH